MDRTGQAHRRRDTVSEHLDVIRAIEQAVADNLNLLAPLGKAWQPSDYLPDLESANWRHEVEGFRPSPINCWWSSLATWSRKKRCLVIRCR